MPKPMSAQEQDITNRMNEAAAKTAISVKPTLPPLRGRPGLITIQNIPGIPVYSDPDLPSGTIEVWQDGKCIGRIEGIGKPSA